MCELRSSPADRRYRRVCQIVVISSLIVFLACSQASLHLHNTAARLPLAAISGAALFAEFLSIGLVVVRLRDEFQRVLLTRSFVWGTLITMAFTMMWGIVEMDAPKVVPHLSIIWIPMMLICLTAGAKLFIFRQHRLVNE